MAQLASALGSGAGNQGNPIHVTVSDREWLLLQKLLLERILIFLISKRSYFNAFCTVLDFNSYGQFL